MQEYFDKVKKWYEEEPERIFIISGYAGCGKTTLARQIPKEIEVDNYRMLAPTGKAATVLGDAQTIHSFIYNATKDKYTGKWTFWKKDKRDFIEELLIVDEISMVNKELLKDLISLDIPIIGLGDPAQLPPVKGTNDILMKPDIMLTKVYRNDGGLLELATDVRQGNPIKSAYNSVTFKYNNIRNDFSLFSADSIIICRYNKTRRELNSFIRRQRNYSQILNVGEKLIVLANNRESGLMNGSIIEISKIKDLSHHKEYALIEIINEYNDVQEIEIALDVLKGENFEYNKYNRSLIPVDYAYAITCHKAQGSEFQDVFVIIEGTDYEDFSNWYYTAITRARKNLYIYNGYK